MKGGFTLAAPTPSPALTSSMAYPYRCLLEVSEEGPRRTPKDRQALLAVLDKYSGAANAGQRAQMQGG